MQNLINSSNDGDIINIAAGTHDWTSGVPVVISKRVTVRGSGAYAVDSAHNDVGSWPVQLNTGSAIAFRINVTGSGTGHPRLTGIHFAGNPTFQYFFSDGNTGGLFVQAWSTNVASYRIDNNLFHSSGPHCGIFANSKGLIDHNYFWADQIEGHCIFVQDFGASGNGDEAWARPTGFGTADFTFIEDNTFRRPSGGVTFENSVVDAYIGGKYVFRHNYVLNASILNHDKSGGGWTRAGVAFEVYDNDFIFQSSASWQTTFYLRDGTLLYYNNRISGFYQAWVKLWNQRMTNSQGNWGVCDGSKGWDGNAGPGGYPCADQVGRGRPAGVGANNVQPQALQPVRMWGNTGTATGGCGGTSQQGGMVCNASATSILAGRDYIFSTDGSAALPGYTPYPYPHPFQSSLAAPTNLRIVP